MTKRLTLEGQAAQDFGRTERQGPAGMCQTQLPPIRMPPPGVAVLSSGHVEAAGPPAGARGPHHAANIPSGSGYAAALQPKGPPFPPATPHADRCRVA